MTFHRLVLRTIALALAVAALGASAASATPMTYQERQAIAAHGQDAPTGPVVLPAGGYLAAPSRPASVAKSSDGADWALIAGIAIAAVAAGVALVAVGRRHTPVTPR